MINSLQLYKKILLLAQNILTMNQGICSLSLLPLRAEPTSKSEMVSQLLFGEVYTILDKKEGWYFIENTADTYKGWINDLQMELLLEPAKQAMIQTIFPFVTAIGPNNNETVLLPVGAVLTNHSLQNNRVCFTHQGHDYLVQTETLKPTYLSSEEAIALAKKFLNAPYLWGGKSAMGIDCSGFTQLFFKCMNIQLPRDAYQQASLGTDITFVEEILPGDLVFFGDTPEKITHVGIGLGDNKILHAAGKVRLDTLDSFGIFNAQINKHTHVLRTIKRYL